MGLLCRAATCPVHDTSNCRTWCLKCRHRHANSGHLTSGSCSCRFHVPDVYKACERFEKLGVEFVKKPDGGSMKGLAFIKDPDGYWIEILNGEGSKQFV